MIEGYEYRKDRDGRTIYIHSKTGKMFYSTKDALWHFYYTHH